MIKKNREDIIIDTFIYIFLAVTFIIFIFPFWQQLVISFNTGVDTGRGGVFLWPREFTLANYKVAFQNGLIFSGFRNSILRVILGTAIGILINSTGAYALSKSKKLAGRNFFLWLFMFTLYFQGGLIPTFLVVKQLGLYNTFWSMILPIALNVFNMIVFMSFFRDLPEALEESAKIDGAGYWTIFFRIIVPISKPVFATIALFTAIQHWNSWFYAAIYIVDDTLYPIQTVLRDVINSNIVNNMAQQLGGNAGELFRKNQYTNQSLISSTMMIATIPIIIIYPFLQRYFVKGMTLGSVKG